MPGRGGEPSRVARPEAEREPPFSHTHEQPTNPPDGPGGGVTAGGLAIGMVPPATPTTAGPELQRRCRLQAG